MELDPQTCSNSDAAPERGVGQASECSRERSALAEATRFELGPERSAELALVRACLAGEGDALARFEREYVACLRAGVAHVRADAGFVEETVAALRVDLFSGEAPKLAAYSGRGPLVAWLRIVASRTALDVCRSERRRRAREQRAHGPGQPPQEPERGLDRARYAQAFASGMRAALRRLQPRERELLLLRYRDGLELDTLGERFGVHRATVQRWLQLATGALRGALSAELKRAGVRLSASDLTGLAPQLRSALSPAIASWLEAAAPDACSQERRP